jgi:hypothetical protein
MSPDGFSHALFNLWDATEHARLSLKVQTIRGAGTPRLMELRLITVDPLAKFPFDLKLISA